ncbi:MAG TPA: CapA family protein, partial [Nitrososphaerales archaeon]|nr:CapA family protein [Nitrososphaerales archaeon]
ISACYDTWHTPWERASNGGSGFPSRPGMNLLRVTTNHTIQKSSLQALTQIKQEAELIPRNSRKATDKNEDSLSFLGHSFKAGEKTGTRMSLVPEDLEAMKHSIRDARKLADWVLVSLHSHTSNPVALEYPSDLIRDLAHLSIDNGADAFLGHGPHILRGIEVYKERPIFYSLGNFIAHNNFVRKVSRDQYDFMNLGHDALPSDFYEARKGDIPPAAPPYSDWWYESIVGVFELTEGGLSNLEAYPISLRNPDLEAEASEAGNPRVAAAKISGAVATRLAGLSGDFGTKLEYSTEKRLLALV